MSKVKRKRKPEKKDRAIEGALGVNIGPVARAQMDLICKFEKLSYSEFARRCILPVLAHYRQHGSLPAVEGIEEEAVKRAGMKRVYTERT
jgi:hypothetical protein